MMERFFTNLFFGVVFTGVGYFLAFHVGQEILDNAHASEKWPYVVGRVVSSGVGSHIHYDSSIRNHEGTRMYRASLAYTYTVDYQEYRSTKVWFGDGWSSSSSSGAEEVAARYPTGRLVNVYYNPENPKEAVLEPGAFFSSYLLFGMGLLFFGLGVMWLLYESLRILLGVGLVGGGIALWFVSRKKRRKIKQSSPPPPPPA
jgi:hypothetical protein